MTLSTEPFVSRHMTEEPPYSITLDMPSRVVQIDEAIGRSQATDASRDLALQRLNRFPGGNGRVRRPCQPLIRFRTTSGPSTSTGSSGSSGARAKSEPRSRRSSTPSSSASSSC